MSVLDPAELLAWITRQRWYAGRGSKPTGAREVADVDLGITDEGGALSGLLIEISYPAGDPQTYFVPVLFADPDTSLPEGAVISRHPNGCVVDALAADSGVRLLLRGLDGPPPGMSGVRLTPSPIVGATVRRLHGEQSHTSVVVDDQYVVKVFRRVYSGDNPEVEIGRALRCIAGARVARFAGALRIQAGEYDVLAAHQRVDGRSGFDLAVADCDLERAGNVGAHFPGAAYELGIALGALHDDLSDTFGSTPEPDFTRTVATRLRRRLESLSDVRELQPYRDVALALYDDLAREDRAAPAQRIHGDLHLGQALFGADGWTFLDFEGEPRRPLDERRTPDSPMRDVAGVLRSFAYAAAWNGAAHHEWQEKNAELFLEGYRLQRPDAEDTSLLRAFVLDKALYEVGYEAAYRPDRISIPLRTLEQVAGG